MKKLLLQIFIIGYLTITLFMSIVFVGAPSLCQSIKNNNPQSRIIHMLYFSHKIGCWLGEEV